MIEVNLKTHKNIYYIFQLVRVLFSLQVDCLVTQLAKIALGKQKKANKSDTGK